MAAGTTEIDLRPIEVGTTAVFKWRGKPVFVRHRTPEEIERARSDTACFNGIFYRMLFADTTSGVALLTFLAFWSWHLMASLQGG